MSVKHSIDPKVAQFGNLARRRECRGGRSLAGNPFLQHSGYVALVLDGTKRFQDMYQEHL